MYLLFFLLLFQGVGAMGGGLTLVLSPSGEWMGMPASYLVHTPFNSFLIPGLILCFLLGILPLSLVYALVRRPGWRWANALNVFSDKHWAWTYTLYTGIMVILWIDVQVFFIGYVHLLQTIIAFVGVFITVLALTPPVQRRYAQNP